MEQSPFSEFDLYGTRMLVFIEAEPHSNKYRQVYLDAEEFRKVSLSIGTVVSTDENGIDEVNVRYSEETYELPDLRERN